MNSYLSHHGVKGQKWGVRRYQNKDGSLTSEGKKHYRKDVVFVSGSSKTQFEDSRYYRKSLPRPITDKLEEFINNKSRIVVGDAPGIDRQVQDFLKKKNYSNVVIYGPDSIRYLASSKWKTKPIDSSEFEKGSPSWLAKKDIAMERASTKGLAVILDEGSQATRNNIKRLIDDNKSVDIFELSSLGKEKDRWIR